MATYRESGVHIDEAARLLALIRERAGDLGGGIGAFGAFFELPRMRRPVLVSSTDGVGTKLEPALAARRYREIGQDCVAMCANDILCHGAAPLYFLDYLACGALDAGVAAEIVGGMIDACAQIGCSLAGGETAEMPGMYAKGTYDVAGFIVGAVEADRLIDGSAVRVGDTLVGIDSNGVHSNGFSLIRALALDWNEDIGGRRLGEALLEPTPLYVGPVLSLLEAVAVHGIAHITGGGLYENVPRMTRLGFRYRIHREALPRNPVFDAIAAGGVAEEEMFRTFNMGTGMVLAVAPGEAESAVGRLASAGLSARVIGRVEDEIEEGAENGAEEGAVNGGCVCIA
ncbi:MAG: phosphoribosylformylglycinamidine cyclo-ligase [Spirochaetota bacterium]